MEYTHFCSPGTTYQCPRISSEVLLKWVQQECYHFQMLALTTSVRESRCSSTYMPRPEAKKLKTILGSGRCWFFSTIFRICAVHKDDYGEALSAMVTPISLCPRVEQCTYITPSKKPKQCAKHVKKSQATCRRTSAAPDDKNTNGTPDRA